MDRPLPRAGRLRSGCLAFVKPGARISHGNRWPTPTVTDGATLRVLWRKSAHMRHSVSLRQALVLEVLGLWPPPAGETGYYDTFVPAMMGPGLDEDLPNPELVEWMMAYPKGWTDA